MMSEDTLKTIERLSQNGWQSDAETVLALVAEIERQREEIAALREALTEIKTDATENMGSVMDIAHYSFKRLARMASEALGDDDNAPAPEPAPRRIVPNVRVKYTATDAAHRSGQLGVIVGSAVDYLEVEFEDGLVEGVKRTELQSV